MASDMNKFKNHPGFIAFKGSNVRTETVNTQLDDVNDAKQELKDDNKYKGGEEGRA